MKRKLLLVLLFTVTLNAFAASVSPETALTVARNFYLQNLHKQNSEIAERYEFVVQQIVSTNDQTPLYYVIDVEGDNGFVFVTGDDSAEPIFGYSTTGKYATENQPENIAKWMEKYKMEMLYIVENNLQTTQEITRKWQQYKNGEIVEKQSESSVLPLLTTTWNQSPYYNALCPYDYNYNQYAVTGCVATAMAQIMKYWEYPSQGIGFHSYNEDDYGTLSANFASTTYNWAAMPNNVTSSNNAVATLMYHCGVSVDMNYGVGGSSAQTLDVANALINYFGYSPQIEGLYKTNYSNVQWINLLKTDLDNNRPIQYAGSGNGGGHSFVCDGYDNNDWFHFNWGWGGSSDGYFDLDYLNPGSLGTGGGTGGFNTNQRAIIGIQPPSGGSTVDVDIELYSDIYVSPNPIQYGQSFTVNADVINQSNNTFYGYITAILFDTNGAFVDAISTLTENNGLPHNYHYPNGIDFTTDGLDAPPGDYYIGIFVLPSGSSEWHYVQDGGYENLIPVSIVYYNDIELYSDITVSPQVITQNQTTSFNYDVANFSGYEFYGSFSIDLHDLEGNWLQTIDQLDEVSLCDNCHFTGGLDFSTSGLNVEPGTYIIAAWEYEDWSGWYLVGSTIVYNNPVYATIAVPPLNPDSYENNNTENTAATLSLNFVGNTANKKTSNANIHIGTDYDYYKINLPSGYNYTINARVQDSYNSNDGQTYTNDVLWSYKIDNNALSDAYDDVPPSSIYVPNGGIVKFFVSPYFQGETGTYALDMSVSRTVATAIDSHPETQTPIFYPNPADNFILFRDVNCSSIDDKITIYNSIGQKIYNNNLCNVINQAIDVSNYAKGIYFVILSNKQGNLSQKLTIK